MYKMRKIIFFFFSIILFTSCGNTPPRINQIYNQINFRLNPGSDAVTTGLSLYINADDDDGDDNIEFIHLVNEENQIFWRADNGLFSYRDRRGMRWLGIDNLSAADGQRLPAGEYKVLLTDRAGDKDEDSIFIPLMKQTPGDEDFAEVQIDNVSNKLVIESSEKRNILSFFDADGVSIAALSVSPGVLNLNRLDDSRTIIEKWHSLEISFYSDRFGAGLIKGPYFRETQAE